MSQAERAIAALEADRFGESLRFARSVLKSVPRLTVLSKVAGLACYKLGRWRDAVGLLRSYEDLTRDLELVPVLMDCYRALGRRAKVAELFEDMRRSPVSQTAMAEARIVAAGSLADSGDMGAAIGLLSASVSKTIRNPAERHLRQWYALGDLYERAGDLPRAREMFVRVARSDPDAYDVASRLEPLGRPRPRTRPRSGDGARSKGSRRP
ncbi:MAG: hypothetical protein ACRDVP_08830 [Acidimicrobiales bacterium]